MSSHKSRRRSRSNSRPSKAEQSRLERESRFSLERSSRTEEKARRNLETKQHIEERRKETKATSKRTFTPITEEESSPFVSKRTKPLPVGRQTPQSTSVSSSPVRSPTPVLSLTPTPPPTKVVPKKTVPKPYDPKVVAKPVKTQESRTVPSTQKSTAHEEQIQSTQSTNTQQTTPKDLAEQSAQTTSQEIEQANEHLIQPESHTSHRSSQQASFQLPPQFSQGKYSIVSNDYLDELHSLADIGRRYLAHLPTLQTLNAAVGNHINSRPHAFCDRNVYPFK